MPERWTADVKQSLSSMVVADESCPADLSVATAGLQVPASQGEAVGAAAAVIAAAAAAAAACSLDATSGLISKPKARWQLPDFCSCSISSPKCLV